jgi:hypothetical protein
MKAMNLFPVAGTSGTEGYQGSKAYAWTVFALTFGLMLSDYLSRQVMGAVFPFLKVTWGVSDSQLGALVSIVALVVGLLFRFRLSPIDGGGSKALPSWPSCGVLQPSRVAWQTTTPKC